MPSSRYYKFKIESQKEKIKKLKILFLIFLFLITILAAAWLIFISPVFKITDIKIPDTDYLGNLSLKVGDNLLTLSKSRLKSELSSAYSEITDIEITKKPFHTVIIDFQKRISLGIWCNEKNCYYFDKNGIIFKEAPQTEGSLILKIKDLSETDTSLGSQVLNKDQINFILSVNNRIMENNKFKILEFKIKPNSSVGLEALTNKNWSIYLDEKQKPIEAVNNLLTILEEAVKNIGNLEYVDLRIPSRIFYKLK